MRKKDNKTAGKQNILKTAPYTLIMLFGLVFFWGFRAVNAANKDGRTEIIPGEAEFENTSIGVVVPTYVPAEGTEGQPRGQDEGQSAEQSGKESAEGTEGQPRGQDDGQSAEDDDKRPDPVENAERLSGEDLSHYPYSLGELEGNCVIYEPGKTDSPYYGDPGKIALDTPAEYVYSDDEYFEDACFIGDSRMVGIFDYSGFDKADFYCDNGYCIHSYKGDKTVVCQNTGKKYTLREAMKRKSYGKIYIMLGTNDCGYGNTEGFAEDYADMLDMIRERQPGALIFLIANLRISESAEKNDKTGVYNNININDKNVAISELADGESIFYFDCNLPFVDERGYLIDEYTFDGFHVYAQQYVEMAELIKNHGIAAE